MPDIASDTPVRFPDRLRLRVPRGLPAAVDAVAERRHTSPSEWMRQALLRALEQEGVRLCDGCVETAKSRQVAV